MKKLLIVLVTFMTLGLTGAALLGSPDVYASAQGQVCSGIGGCDESPTQITNTVRNVVNVLSAIIGVVTVIVMVVAGFRFVTSGGDSSKVAGAKNTMIYAIVGLILVLLSQSLVRFVLQRAT